MSARDELAQLLADDWNPDRDPILTAMFRDYAESILTAGWRPPARIIETAEELDALPNEAVIRDANGEMSMHINVPNKFNPAGRRIKWWGDCQGYGWNIPVLPATVVYTPEES